MLHATLLTDGSSDRVLQHVIRWALSDRGMAAQVQWAELRTLRQPPLDLLGRAREALRLYPGDVLFVHRDAEAQTRSGRASEIQAELADLGATYVCVIPVRMTEAWLLFDEGAIRTAASNPAGDIALGLPDVREHENLSDPKEALHQALRAASGLRGRRLDRFERDIGRAVHRVAELISTYAPLRSLAAFREFERELEALPGDGGLSGRPTI